MGGRLWVIGGSGFVGRHVVRAAQASGWAVVAGFTRTRGDLDCSWQHVDLAAADSIRDALGAASPDAVVNAGADFTGDPVRAWEVNARGPVRLAVATAAAGVRLVHVSTDCVHGGADTAYPDLALPTPQPWAYAVTKAAAEAGVLAVDPGAAVARPSVILGDPLFGERRPGPHDHTDGTYFQDMVRMPVYVTDLAAVVVELAGNRLAGTLHVAGPDALSRWELARLLARRQGADPATVRAARLSGTGLARPGTLLLERTRLAGLRTPVRSVRGP